MKAKLLIAVLMLVGVGPAQANDQGAWVKVDSSGNAVGQAIVCTPDVCGDTSSPYAKATLAAGERYVLQTKADPVTKNVAGYNKGPDLDVRVDSTNTWTVISTVMNQSPKVSASDPSITVIKKTIQTFNPVTEQEPTSNTVTIIQREFEYLDANLAWDAWWKDWLLEWDLWSLWVFDTLNWGNL